MADKPAFDLCVVIDDDADILLAARLLLRELFTEVVTTPSPAQALEVIATRSPTENPAPAPTASTTPDTSCPRIIGCWMRTVPKPPCWK